MTDSHAHTPGDERRHRLPLPDRAAQPQEAVARVVGLLRLVGVRRRPRHRVQRDPRGGRADRRLARCTSTGSAGPTRSRLVDRVITRDATKLKRRAGLLHAVVRRARQGHRRRHGPPRSPTTRSAGPPPIRSSAGSTLNARGLDVEIEDVTERSPRSRSRARSPRAVLEAATGEPFADLRYFRRRPARIRVGRRRIAIDVVADRLHRRPRLRAVDPGRATRPTPGTR